MSHDRMVCLVCWFYVLKCFAAQNFFNDHHAFFSKLKKVKIVVIFNNGHAIGPTTI